MQGATLHRYEDYKEPNGEDQQPADYNPAEYGYGYPGMGPYGQVPPSWAQGFPGYGYPGMMPPPPEFMHGCYRGPDGAAVAPPLPQRPSSEYRLDSPVAAVEVLAPDSVRQALERHDCRGLESATVRNILDPAGAYREQSRHDAARSVSYRAGSAALDDLARARAIARKERLAQNSESEYQRASAEIQPALDRAKQLQERASLLMQGELVEDRRSIRSAMGSTLRADPVQKIVARWAN